MPYDIMYPAGITTEQTDPKIKWHRRSIYHYIPRSAGLLEPLCSKMSLILLVTEGQEHAQAHKLIPSLCLHHGH